MLIDSHVNLHAPQFDADRDEVIARARTAGVSLMLAVCDKISNFEAVHALAMRHDDIWLTVGAHPHEARNHTHLSASLLGALALRPKVAAIGETGLDFHYDLSPRDIQERLFRIHIEAARSTGLPLIVHARDADESMADILEEEHRRGPFAILMHCYTSGLRLAERAAALGAWFSVSGIATFRAAQPVREAIAAMPAEKILVETDCPYLAPAPMRGRRNEPAFLTFVLAELARIRGWSVEEAERRTEAAFFGLFARIKRP
ncbi:MAG TPA: TatD family hydrolase [Caulobacteraceae bacterium]